MKKFVIYVVIFICSLALGYVFGEIVNDDNEIVAETISLEK